MSEKKAVEIAVAEATLIRAEQNLQRHLDWIGRFDTRCATVLGIAVAMLGFFVTEAPPPVDWDLYCSMGTAAFGMTIAASFFYIYKSQYPKTDSPNESLVYFGTIASLSSSDFIERARNRNDHQHFEDLCHQTHLNAVLVTKKFAALKLALVWLLFSVIFWITTIVWFHVVKS